MKSNLFLVFILALMSTTFAGAKEQLVVVNTQSQTLDLFRFAKENKAQLKFRGDLSFGKMYLLESDKEYHSESLVGPNALVSDNTVITIGPPLIKCAKILPQNFLNQDMSAWQWGLHNTGSNTPVEEGRPKPHISLIGYDSKAFEAWAILKPAKKEVVVAVIDSGVDIHHQDLKDHIWTNEKELHGIPGKDNDGNGYIDDVHGYSMVDNSPDVSDQHGHGTHCSGVIAADHDNQIGIMGLAPGVKIMPIKIFNAQGMSKQEYVIKAIDYAVRMNADVISASWGGGPKSDIMYKAIEAAKNKNIMFVAAAGNEGADNDSTPFFPANYELDNVISVAAHQNSGALANFSNFGLNKVHISAPGQFILSTLPDDKYAVWSGTSMATPHVAAAIALLIQQVGPLPAIEIKRRLLDSSIPQMSWRKSLVSMGRLNVEGLLLNKKIDRGLPVESEWKVFTAPAPLYETKHPMTEDNVNLVKDFNVPGAKFLRLVFSKVDIMSGNYPSLHTREPLSKSEPEEISLKINNIFKSDFIMGDKIGFRLNVPYSGSWGVRIEAIEYQ